MLYRACLSLQWLNMLHQFYSGFLNILSINRDNETVVAGVRENHIIEFQNRVDLPWHPGTGFRKLDWSRNPNQLHSIIIFQVNL